MSECHPSCSLSPVFRSGRSVERKGPKFVNSDKPLNVDIYTRTMLHPYRGLYSIRLLSCEMQLLCLFFSWVFLPFFFYSFLSIAFYFRHFQQTSMYCLMYKPTIEPDRDSSCFSVSFAKSVAMNKSLS